MVVLHSCYLIPSKMNITKNINKIRNNIRMKFNKMKKVHQTVYNM